MLSNSIKFRYLKTLPGILLVLLFSISSWADSGEPATPGVTTNPPLPDPLQAGWEGTATCEKLYEDGINRMLRCTFPPGFGHERHYHRPHFGYALAGGSVRLIDANGVRDVDLEAGSSYYSEGVVWHEVLNIGDTTVQYLIAEQK